LEVCSFDGPFNVTLINVKFQVGEVRKVNTAEEPSQRFGLVCVESKDGCKLVPDVCKGGLLANSRVF
jgi:hypothetical protein